MTQEEQDRIEETNASSLTQDDSVAEARESAEAEKETMETLKGKLAAAQERADRLLANWQRAQADYSNLKRRSEQERDELGKYANAMLMLNLLPIVDDLERALESVSTKLAGLTWVEGVHLIYRKLQAVLENHGLREIQAVGMDFDPTLHEAILYGEGVEGKVIELLQKGYKLHDRVIRPAMVKVGQGKGPAEGEAQESEEKAGG